MCLPLTREITAAHPRMLGWAETKYRAAIV
jgi:hypothetical protein